jgi:hypothetical protein
LQDLSSGAAYAKFQQEKTEQIQRDNARVLIEQLRKDREKGVLLDEFLSKMLADADKLDKASESGLKALDGQDFSGLAALGNLPFTGLQSLNGITITIK